MQKPKPRHLGACSKRRTSARGNVTSCIQDTSRAVSNAVNSFQCRRKPFGLLPQGMRLRHPCRRLDRLDAALELRHGKETAASCIMMQSMTVPLAVRLVNLTFPSRLLGPHVILYIPTPYTARPQPRRLNTFPFIALIMLILPDGT